MKKIVWTFLLMMVVVFTGYIFVKYYSYIFAHRISGEVVDVQRVTDPTAIINNGGTIPPNLIFSFSVAIRSKTGEIMTASTEDRQWAVVHKGQCAEAEFFPYPPWDLSKRGTYFGARLLKLSDCPVKVEP